MPLSAPLLLILGVSFQAPVTIAAPAQPLSRLIPAIAKQTGASIEVGPSLADEVVCVKVNQVPLEQLLGKIAYVEDADWVKTDTGRRLTRTPGAAAERRRREETVLAEGVRRGQEKLAETLKAQSMWNVEEAEKLAQDAVKLMRAYNPNSMDAAFYNRQQALESRSPLTRFMNQILLGLDPRDLARMRPHRRYVWSSDPTAMEYRLSPKALAAASNLARDYGYWLAAAKKFGIGSVERNGMTYSLGGMFEINESQQKAGAIARILLIGQMYSWQNGLTFELQVADSTGKVIGTARQTLTEIAWEALQAPAKPGTDLIPPAPEATAMVSSFNGKERKPLPAEILNRLKSPTTEEPLALFASPTLFTIADRQKENLVASLSDGMTSLLFSTMNPMSAASIREMATGILHQDWQEADGWLTVRSNTPIWDRETFVSRKALQLLVEQTLSKRRQSLDEKARLASMLPSEMDNPLPIFLKQLLTTKANGMVIGMDEEALRFYGLLDSATFSQMQTGSGAQVRNLANAVAAKIHELVYHSDPWSIQLAPMEGQTIDPTMFEKFYSGLMKEPAESMPDGIPSAATIKATVKSETVAKPLQTASTNQFVFIDDNGMDPNSLAWQMFETSRPDLFPYAVKQNEGVDFTKFRVATRRTIEFDIRLTPILKKTITLHDVEFPEDKVVSYKDLPEDFKKQLDAALAEQKKNYANTKPGDFTGAPTRTNGQPR